MSDNNGPAPAARTNALCIREDFTGPSREEGWNKTQADAYLEPVRALLLRDNVIIPGWKSAESERRRFRSQVAQALVSIAQGEIPPAAMGPAARRLASQVTGVGTLTPLLSEPGIEEIIVRNGHVQVERYGRIEDLGDLAGDDHFYSVAMRAADLGGRTMKADQPFVLVDLPGGDRLTAMIPALSANGTAINIRVFAQRRLSFHDLAAAGAFDERDNGRASPASGATGRPKPSLSGQVDDPHLRRFLADTPDNPVARFLARVAAENAATTLISGEFSSGKTTLLNAMSLYFPPTLQLAVVETFQELQLQHPYPARAVVPVEQVAGQVSMREVVNVIYTRMRPDAIVIGEIVGAEAVEFLRAVNLGKKAYSTIHGNSPLDALYHLEDLDLGSGLPLPAIRERIARGVDLVVHMRQDFQTGQRYVDEIVAVDDRLSPDDRYQLHSLWRATGSERQSPVDRLTGIWQEVRDAN